MTFSRRKWTAAGIALAALIVGGVVLARSFPAPLEAGYPEPPFHPVAKDFPRFIALAEPPEGDDDALRRYWMEWRRVRRRLHDEGAFQRATPEEQSALEIDPQDKPVEARERAEKS